MHFPVTAPLVKKRLERSAELIGATPSICLRRPLCRLKAPLGLSLLRKCGRSKREIKMNFPLKMPRAQAEGILNRPNPAGFL